VRKMLESANLEILQSENHSISNYSYQADNNLKINSLLPCFCML
jgi:hypothetical protein